MSMPQLTYSHFLLPQSPFSSRSNHRPLISIHCSRHQRTPLLSSLFCSTPLFDVRLRFVAPVRSMYEDSSSVAGQNGICHVFAFCSGAADLRLAPVSVQFSLPSRWD